MSNENSHVSQQLFSVIRIIRKEKIDVIHSHWLVPQGLVVKHEDDTNLKEDFDARHLILNVGRLIDLKGTKYLIIAMKDVTKKFPNAKLVVVGDGPEKETLIKINANYDRDWPGCNTSRWFIDALLKNLKKNVYGICLS